MADKRNDKRRIKRIDLEFYEEGVKFRGFSSNFSHSGMFLRTNHAREPGSVIDIVLFLPNGHSCRLKGKVIRSARYLERKVAGAPMPKNGMGIEIIEKDEHYEDFVRSLPE